MLGTARPGLTPSLLRILVVGVLLVGCGMENPKLESSQQQFLDEFNAVNRLTSEDYVVGTENSYGNRTSYIHSIYIAKKPLVAVPPSVSNLKYLETLMIMSCGLDSLPNAILSMPQVKGMSLDSNHLCSVSPSMDSFLIARSPYWKEKQVCK